MPDIIYSILEQRKKDIKQKGFGMGYAVPRERTRPVVPFLPSRGVILEVKRASPSKGDIATGLDAAAAACGYVAAGARAISVLTEEHWFKGSLADLADVSNAVGNKAAVLRKDFLYHPDEVDIAYLCGADAVLVIARMLDAQTITEMIGRVSQRGMSALVELRTEDDVHKVKTALCAISDSTHTSDAFPSIIYGVNARDLKDFSVDMLQPLAMIGTINEVLGDVKVITESGVKTPHSAKIAGSMGFWGLLLGEAAVRAAVAGEAPESTVIGNLNSILPPSIPLKVSGSLTVHMSTPIDKEKPSGAKDFVDAFLSGTSGRNAAFWRNVAQKRAMMNAMRRIAPMKYRPLVKICGLTRTQDAMQAAAAGADFLGFVFWKKSKRCATEIVVREVRKMLDSMTWSPGKKPLMVGVVADSGLAAQAAINLAREGVFDAVQFHGCCAEEVKRGDYDGIAHYAAVNAGSKEDIQRLKDLVYSGQMRVLVDAMAGGALSQPQHSHIRSISGASTAAESKKLPGGTGVRVDSALCAEVAKVCPLWLAGGIKPDNVARIVNEVRPELIDVSSGVESNPGIKSQEKIEKLIDSACVASGEDTYLNIAVGGII